MQEYLLDKFIYEAVFLLIRPPESSWIKDAKRILVPRNWEDQRQNFFSFYCNQNSQPAYSDTIPTNDTAQNLKYSC